MSLISHKILYTIIIIILWYYYYILLLLLISLLCITKTIIIIIIYYIYITYAWFYLFLYIYANYIKLFCNKSASEYDIWICSWHMQGVKQNKWYTIYIIHIFTQSYIQSDTTIYIHIRPMIMTLIDSNCGYK